MHDLRDAYTVARLAHWVIAGGGLVWIGVGVAVVVGWHWLRRRRS